MEAASTKMYESESRDESVLLELTFVHLVELWKEILLGNLVECYKDYIYVLMITRLWVEMSMNH